MAGNGHAISRRTAVTAGLAGLMGVAGVTVLDHFLEQAPPGYKHVLLIVSDSLRADRLGCYGYTTQVDGVDKSPSPALDELAERGAVFFSNFSQSDWTQTSMASLLYSRIPRTRVRRPSLEFVPESDADDYWALLNRTRRETGRLYDRVTFQTNEVCNQGVFTNLCDTFRNLTGRQNVVEGDMRNSAHHDASIVVAEILGYIDRAGKAGKHNLFIYAHLMDTHEPYDPEMRLLRRVAGKKRGMPFHEVRDALNRDGLTEEVDKAIQHLERRYVASVMQVDEAMDTLINGLDQRDMLDDSLVVFTADHGQSLGERNVLGHCQTLYPTETWVPLLMMGKGVPAGTFITTRTRSLDILPTIAQYVDPLFEPAMFDGESLFALTERANSGRPVPQREVYSLQDYAHRMPQIRRDLLITPGGKAYIKTTDREGKVLRRECYNIDSDRDMVNEVDVEAETMAALDVRLAEIVEGGRRSDAKSQTGESSLNPVLRRQLHALGYLQ